jgi:hypothetical protein
MITPHRAAKAPASIRSIQKEMCIPGGFSPVMLAAVEPTEMLTCRN